MKTQLKKGVLEMCVLSLLQLRDHYAYEIVSNLSSSIGISEGTIYPLMRRLRKEEYVSTYLMESESGPPRKYYRLEREGLTRLIEMKDEWLDFSSQINSLINNKMGRVENE